MTSPHGHSGPRFLDANTAPKSVATNTSALRQLASRKSQSWYLNQADLSGRFKGMRAPQHARLWFSRPTSVLQVSVEIWINQNPTGSRLIRPACQTLAILDRRLFLTRILRERVDFNPRPPRRGIPVNAKPLRSLPSSGAGRGSWQEK